MDNPDAPAAPDAGVFGLDDSPEDARVVLIPAPYEATVSYGRGTSRGPEGILQASKQIDLFDLDTGHPYTHGIAMLPLPEQLFAWNAEACEIANRVIAAGGVENDPDVAEAARQVDAISEQVNDWVEAQVGTWIDRGKLVGLIGGDHSVAYGSIAAHAARHPGLGLLHVDAHLDLRVAFEGFTWSHASVLYNVAQRVPEVGKVVGVGFRDVAESEMDFAAEDPRFEAHYDPHLRQRLHNGATWAALCREIVDPLPEKVYLTVDIDGLDPSLCPGTGTPVPGGLGFAEFVTLVREVVASGRTIVGFDLVEVAPRPNDDWDANVGARILYKLIGFALNSRP